MSARLPERDREWSGTCPECGAVFAGIGGMGPTNTLTRHRIASHQTSDQQFCGQS